MFNKDGELIDNLWTNYTTQGFEKRAQCMEEQYSRYSINGGELGQIEVSHMGLRWKTIQKSELLESSNNYLMELMWTFLFTTSVNNVDCLFCCLLQAFLRKYFILFTFLCYGFYKSLFNNVSDRNNLPDIHRTVQWFRRVHLKTTDRLHEITCICFFFLREEQR